MNIFLAFTSFTLFLPLLRVHQLGTTVEIKREKARWFGHVERRDTEMDPTARRKRGTPRNIVDVLCFEGIYAGDGCNRRLVSQKEIETGDPLWPPLTGAAPQKKKVVAVVAVVVVVVIIIVVVGKNSQPL